MTSTNFSDAAAQLATELEDAGIDADPDELEADMTRAVEDFYLSEEEAIRTVKNNRTPDNADIDSILGGGNSVVTIDELAEHHEQATDSAWVTLEAVQVMGTWQVDHNAIDQKVEVADETGRCEITVWQNEDSPTFSEGEVVRLENVPTDEYQGSYNIKIAPEQSVVERVDADVDPAENLHQVSGRVVAAREGLIERCSAEECNRTLDKGRCEEHGAVDGEHDLRLKLVVDNGVEAHNVMLNREMVEEVLGTSLDEQLAHLEDTLDRDTTNEAIQEDIIGAEMSVEGPEMYGYIIADEFALLESIEAGTVNAALVKAREAKPEF